MLKGGEEGVEFGERRAIQNLQTHYLSDSPYELLLQLDWGKCNRQITQPR